MASTLGLEAPYVIEMPEAWRVRELAPGGYGDGALRRDARAGALLARAGGTEGHSSSGIAPHSLVTLTLLSGMLDVELLVTEDGTAMALTRDFREMVVARAERDAKYRRALLETGIEMLLTGDPDDAEIGRESIRTYINATIGFEALAKRTRKSAKSLMRMFSRSGNPSLSSLSAVIGELQKAEGIRLGVTTARAS